MTRFSKVFLRDRLDGRIHVAVFGKHPAWMDHIDDLGLSTESLAMAKRLLYLEGIAGQLASGAWDRIEGSGQAMDFDHRFVWCRDKQAIVGAIRASSDGKGRARFPLVICAQGEVSGCEAVGLYLAPVEQLGLQCKSVASQAAVRDFYSRASADLNVRTFSSPAAPAKLTLDDRDRHEDFILEVLVGLANELKRVSGRSLGDRGVSAHSRVVPVSAQAKANLEFWSGYLERRANFHQPYLVIAAEMGPPIDLIIGEPDPKDFFCLRADDSALPPLHSGALGKARARFEAEARDYLSSCGVALRAAPSRKSSWMSNFFGKRL
jgi:hypothetical protein